MRNTQQTYISVMTTSLIFAENYQTRLDLKTGFLVSEMKVLTGMKTEIETRKF